MFRTCGVILLTGKSTIFANVDPLLALILSLFVKLTLIWFCEIFGSLLLFRKSSLTDGAMNSLSWSITPLPDSVGTTPKGLICRLLPSARVIVTVKSSARGSSFKVAPKSRVSNEPFTDACDGSTLSC